MSLHHNQARIGWASCRVLVLSYERRFCYSCAYWDYSSTCWQEWSCLWSPDWHHFWIQDKKILCLYQKYSYRPKFYFNIRNYCLRQNLSFSLILIIWTVIATYSRLIGLPPLVTKTSILCENLYDIMIRNFYIEVLSLANKNMAT